MILTRHTAHLESDMAYKEILTYVESRAASRGTLDLAAGLAAAHEAHLVALHVIEPPVVLGSDMAMGAPVEFIEWQQDYARKCADQARRYTTEIEKRCGCPIEWREPEGGLNQMALLHSRYADLVVVTQSGEGAVGNLPELFVMGSGRPTLIVPHEGTFTRPLERILVAWNRTREATRALHDSIPLLAGAKSVTVMEVNPESGMEHHIAGADIARHLARHRVQVTVSSTAAEGMQVGDVILSRAADFGADCIVMGAYGHSRLREFAFGGATRQILETMTVPVFMAH
jgi:nucleotide-binding universal stress UspA family protein